LSHYHCGGFSPLRALAHLTVAPGPHAPKQMKDLCHAYSDWMRQHGKALAEVKGKVLDLDVDDTLITLKHEGEKTENTTEYSMNDIMVKDVEIQVFATFGLSMGYKDFDR
jgi:hypothetical protein